MQIISSREEHNRESGTRIVQNRMMDFDFSKVLDRKKGAAAHERADLISKFVEKLNNNPKYPVTFRQINGQLRYCTIHDLYVLFKECERARSFGGLFWYKLKNNSWSKKPVEKNVD